MKALHMGGFALGLGLGVAWARRQERSRYSFRGRTVVITGGSRGLGLVMARQLAQEGARLALIARDRAGLDRAVAQINQLGAEALRLVCDVRKQEEVNQAIAQVVAQFGGIDVLINNAGIIQVGPLDRVTVEDFEEALGIHLYGPLFCTLATLPYLRRARGGRIVNVSSIGGKLAVPHLLPYSASKFALVGLSDGLRAELRRDNIRVTTVCPGLMRTGSPRNAFFKGQHRREFAWFVLGDSLPGLSVSVERAAREIIRACRRGDARLLISLPAKAAVLLNELFPGVSASLMDVANRLLPNPGPESATEKHPGHESRSPLSPRWLTRLTDQAALANNQVPA